MRSGSWPNAIFHKELATNLVLRESVAAVQDTANSR